MFSEGPLLRPHKTSFRAVLHNVPLSCSLPLMLSPHPHFFVVECLLLLSLLLSIIKRCIHCFMKFPPPLPPLQKKKKKHIDITFPLFKRCPFHEFAFRPQAAYTHYTCKPLHFLGSPLPFLCVNSVIFFNVLWLSGLKGPLKHTHTENCKNLHVWSPASLLFSPIDLAFLPVFIHLFQVQICRVLSTVCLLNRMVK